MTGAGFEAGVVAVTATATHAAGQGGPEPWIGECVFALFQACRQSKETSLVASVMDTERTRAFSNSFSCFNARCFASHITVLKQWPTVPSNGPVVIRGGSPLRDAGLG